MFPDSSSIAIPVAVMRIGERLKLAVPTARLALVEACGSGAVRSWYRDNSGDWRERPAGDWKRQGDHLVLDDARRSPQMCVSGSDLDRWISQRVAAEDWILCSTAVERMAELNPIYQRFRGAAIGRLESAITAGRLLLQGRPPGSDEFKRITDALTSRHRLDLIHNRLSVRLRPHQDDTLFNDVQIEWTHAAKYLGAVEASTLDATAVGTVATPAATLPARASRDQIHRAIARVYDDAGGLGERAPNVRELPKLVKARLNAEGLDATYRQIEECADEPEHRARRRPVGRTIASERHRPKG